MISHRPLFAAALAGLAFSASSCDNRDFDAKNPDGTKVIPPGAQTAGPEVALADYAKLGWENEAYTLNDEPFTGIATKTSDDGKIEGRYNITDGKLHGVVEEWWPNGVRNTLKTYVNGSQDGVSTYWDEAGVPFKVTVHRNGEQIEVIEDPEKLAKIPN